MGLEPIFCLCGLRKGAMSLPSTSRLASLIAPAVSQLGFEFVACEFVSQGSRMLLRIYIDSPNGITVRDCEIVSRQLGAVLDVEDPFLGRYYLEVSSPGSDRLLVTPEHYQRYIGHLIKVKIKQSRNGRRNYSGLLQSVADGNITIIVDGDTIILPISEIEKANLVPNI